MSPVLCARKKPAPASAHNGDMTIGFLDLLHQRSSSRGPASAFVYDARFGEVDWRLAGGWAERPGERETGLGRTKRPRLAFPLHAPAGCPAAKFPKATLVE